MYNTHRPLMYLTILEKRGIYMLLIKDLIHNEFDLNCRYNIYMTAKMTSRGTKLKYYMTAKQMSTANH